MPVRIRVKRKGKPLKTHITDVNNLRQGIETETRLLGKDTESKMRDLIRESIKRPGSQGALEKSIDVEYFADGVSWGVGNIAKLPIYWASINFGSSHLVGTTTKGQFVPGDPKPSPNSFRDGRLQKGFYKVNISRPIPAVNYVQRTANWLFGKIATLIQKTKARR